MEDVAQAQPAGERDNGQSGRCRITQLQAVEAGAKLFIFIEDVKDHGAGASALLVISSPEDSRRKLLCQRVM